MIQSTGTDSLQQERLSLFSEPQKRAIRVSESNASELQSDTASEDQKEANSGVERQLLRWDNERAFYKTISLMCA